MLKTILRTGMLGLFISSSVLAAEVPGLDINDVAVLFPLDSQAKTYPRISLSDGSQSLLSPTVFHSVIQKARGLGVSEPFPAQIDQLADWDIVAYRVDPCAPHGDEGPQGRCRAELRLVVQPSTSVFGPADSALHLLYDIDAQARTVYQELVAIKAKSAASMAGFTTTGKPLGVHPLLQLEVMGGVKGIAELHERFIRSFAEPARLKKVTLMGLRDSLAVDWIFMGGDVVQGVWTQGPIPNLNQGEDGFIEFDLRRDVNSFSTRPLDERLSTFDFFSVDIPPTTAVTRVLAEAAHRLENPALANRNTADCLSCHSATSMRIHPIANMPFAIPGLTAQAPAGITAFPEPLALQNHELHWNLRAFGYFDRKPTLAMRTVYEAAGSAAAINEVLGLDNPAQDCVGQEADVLSCFIRSSTIDGPQKTTEECLESCRKKSPGGFLDDFLSGP